VGNYFRVPGSGFLDQGDCVGAVAAPVALFVLDDDVTSALGRAGGAGVSRGAGREGVDEELGALAGAIEGFVGAALGFGGLGGGLAATGLDVVVVARGGRGEGGDAYCGDGDGARDLEEWTGLAAEHAGDEDEEREELSPGDARHGGGVCKRSARVSYREIVGDRDRTITRRGVAGLHRGAKRGSRLT
jgi:hypothetical protein